MKKSYKIVLRILGFLLFLNLLHTFFIYHKGHHISKLNIEVTTTFNTYCKFSIYPKYSDSLYNTESVDIDKGVPKKLELTIDEDKGVSMIGIYYGLSNKGEFKINNASFQIEDKLYPIEDISDLINYSSDNLTLISNKNEAVSTSTEPANAWIIFNVEKLDSLTKKIKYRPFLWKTNLLLLLFIFGLYFIAKPDGKILKNLCPIGNKAEKYRVYSLMLWAFLFPFWNSGSHVLMAISLLFFVIHYIKDRRSFKFAELKIFIPFIFLFFLILSFDIVLYKESFLKDLGFYSYFFLAPFLFLGISKQNLTFIVTIYKWGIFLYLVLFITATIERYFDYEVSTSFQAFLFSTTEIFWQTSYLANLIAIALIFELNKNWKKKTVILICILSILLFYLIEARLPLFIFLFIWGTIIISGLIKNLTKGLRFGIFIIATVIIGLFILYPQKLLRDINKNLLYTKTEKIDSRIKIWNGATGIVKTNFWTGVGPNNVRDEIANSLAESSKIKYRNYNAHNQYLEFLVSYGVVILAGFIVVLLYPLVLYKKHYVLFILYFGLAMMVESYLVRQAGIVFFSFWYSLIIYYDRES